MRMAEEGKEDTKEWPREAGIKSKACHNSLPPIVFGGPGDYNEL